MLYVAGPYSPQTASQCKDPEAHFEAMCAAHLRITSNLMRKGNVVFSPIVYGHQLRHHGTSATAWVEFNEHMVSHSNGVVLTQIPGWDKSKGVAIELMWAKVYSLPIYVIGAGYQLIKVNAALQNDILKERISLLQQYAAGDLPWPT